MPRPKNDEERQEMIDQAVGLIMQAQRILVDVGATRSPKLMAHFRRIVLAEKGRPMFPEGNMDPYDPDPMQRRPLHVRRNQD